MVYFDPLGLQAERPPLPGRRDPFSPPFPPDFPSGPWGNRPDSECCDKRQIDRRIEKTKVLGKGTQVAEVHGATSVIMGLRHEGGPWFSRVPLGPFERPCTDRDPCIRFCCNVHEFFHYSDPRWIKVGWDQQTSHQHDEAPAYGVERACLRTF